MLEPPLTTLAELPLRSPLATQLSRADQAASAALTLSDLTGLGLLQLRGPEAALRAADPQLPGEIGQAAPYHQGLAARLTDDEWLLIAPQPAPQAEDGWRLASAGSAQPGEAERAALITATDLSHGLAVLLLAGPQSRATLAKLCGLDLADRSFPDLRAAYASLAKVRAQLLRRDHADRPAYLIAVGRSLAGYVWELLLDAAAEFQPAVVAGQPLIHNALEGKPAS